MSLASTAKRHTTTIVLSVLAASAALYVFIVDKGAITTHEAEHRKRNLFPAWRSDDLANVTIERSGKTAQLLRRPADANGQRFWDLQVDKEKFAAEEQQVDQFLGTLEFATYERFVEPGSVDANTLGVDHPRLRVSVTMNDRPTVLTLGANASSPPGAVFVEVQSSIGTNQYVISKELAAALDMDPASFRARRLIPYATSDVARFEIATPTGTFHLERVKPNSDEMRLSGPTPEAKKRVARQPLNEMLITLGRTDAASFVADDVADKASKPSTTFTFIPRDASRPRGVLVIGGACPDNPEQVVAIQREPVRISACIAKDIAAGLSRPADSFVDKGLFLSTIDEVQEIVFVSGDKRLELARKGSDFHQRAPVDRTVDASAGRGLLEELFQLRATKIVTEVDRVALGLDKPYGTIRLTSLLPARGEDGGDDERIEELVVGQPRGDEVAVSLGAEGNVLMLPKSALTELFPTDLALRSLTVIDMPETAVHALRIQQDDEVQRIERTAEGGWKLTEPVGLGFAADIGLASDLVATLFPLKADKFVASKDDGTFGFEKPRAIIDAELGSGDAGVHNLRLLIGFPTIVGSFARLDGDDAVFVVPKSVEMVMNQWLLDRAVLVFDLRDIVRVTVTQLDKKKKPLVLEQVGEAFRIVGAPSATSAAAKLRDALSDLIPFAAVSLGPPRKGQGFDPPTFTMVIERVKRDGDTNDRVIDPQRTVRLQFGAREYYRSQDVMYVRRDGVDATYAVDLQRAMTFIDVLY